VVIFFCPFTPPIFSIPFPFKTCMSCDLLLVLLVSNFVAPTLEV
jgi:hypothetical protein